MLENLHPFIIYSVKNGVPIETVTLILMLPVVVTIIAFFRQIIGIKAFGIYTPALMTFAFFAIGLGAESFFKGVKYGVAIFFTVIISGTLARFFLKKLRLLYLPRVAIVITITAFCALALLLFGGTFRRTGLSSIYFFPILIMITLAEKFVATQIEKGPRAAIILSLETLLISLICYFVISWREFVNHIQRFPWLVFLTIFINLALGKWTGLRLSEYFRFKLAAKNVSTTKK